MTVNGPIPALPGEPAGGWYHSPQEIERWARQRRPGEREKPPRTGEKVLFREQMFGQAVPAVVTAVQDLSSPHDHWNRHGGLEAFRGPGEPDPNVWDWNHEERGFVLREDPWPWVQLQAVITDGRGRAVRGEDGQPVLQPPRWCREARVRGSPGWLRKGSRAHTGNYEE